MITKARLNIRNVLKDLEERKVTIFSSQIFAKIFSTTASRAVIFLSDNTKRGYFIRIKKGIYSPTNFQPSPLELANILYKPSYISLEIALSFYHIIPETVYSITSITTKHSKETTVQKQIFTYSRLPRNLYFGYEYIKVGNKKVVIATKEKAFLDYLYFIARGQKTLNKRLNLENLEKDKLSRYSKIFFNNIKVIYIRKRLGLLLQKLNLQ
jgi:predicted transcriptional regulator of viral defense system